MMKKGNVMAIEVQRGMIRKTINRNINYKIDEWLKSLKFSDKQLYQPLFPEHLKLDRDKAIKVAKKTIKNDIIVTGGAIASMLHGEMPNDIDVYFKTKRIARFVAQYYVDTMLEKASANKRVCDIDVAETETGVKICVRSAGVVSGDGSEVSEYQYFEADPNGEATEQYVVKVLDKYQSAAEDSYECVYMSSNAITLAGDLQLVLRFVGPAEEIHKNFDFIHATNYWTAASGTVLNADAMEALLTRRLVYSGSRFPICSLFRIRKFLNRGFTISASEIFKIAWDINKLELSNLDVLEDQLMGVDQAYFMEVISVLKQEGLFNSDKPLDRTYLFSLLDRIFEEDM